MSISLLFLFVVGMMLLAYSVGLKRAAGLAAKAKPTDATNRPQPLHSLPIHYGLLTACIIGIPAIFLIFFWLILQDTVVTWFLLRALPAEYANLGADRLSLALNDIKNLAMGNIVSTTVEPELRRLADYYLTLQHRALLLLGLSILLLASIGLIFSIRRIKPELRARNHVEAIFKILLFICAAVAILTTIGIVLSVLFESIRFFQLVPLQEFLFGLHWSPQIALRADQQAASGAFGVIPLFVGTLLISAIAMLVAAPIGLMAAIYLSQYANQRIRTIMKPLLEVLAGIPTVVYGVFAALTMAPFIRNLGESIGLSVASESALAAGLVMGIMIIPFVSSLSEDAISAVPRALRDGSYGLGATPSETIKQVILPAALPGIAGGMLLAISRAIGETMIVVMAAGLAAKLTFNPLEAVTTVTVQIVTLLVGDQEFDSAKTLAAFALGLVLFLATLLLNVLALHIVRKYREQYE